MNLSRYLEVPQIYNQISLIVSMFYLSVAYIM